MKVFRWLTLIHLILSTLWAQSPMRVVDAFRRSYKFELDGDYEKAIKALQEVYNEHSYEINLRLGWLYYNWGKLDESIKFYKIAMKLMPSSIEAKLGYVLPQAAKNNWEEVLNTYLEILKLDPYNSVVLYRTGLIYFNTGDYANARKYFEKLVSAYPFSYDGVSMLAWTYYRLNKKGEAKSYFYRALLLNPEDTLILQTLKELEN